MTSFSNTGNFQERGSYFTAGESVNLNNCDKEPIHIPGSIQPHGVLIGFSAEGEVLYKSANLEDFFGETVSLQRECHLREIIGEEAAAVVIEKRKNSGGKKYFPLEISQKDGTVQLFDAQLHLHNAVYILELEPVKGKGTAVDLDYFNESMQHLQEAVSPEELANIVAQKIRQLTGFGRVMVYRFNEDGSGVVFAEEKEEDMDPFLGLWYPATDIPQQARKLYLQNPLRIIPDVHYTPSEIKSVPENGPERPSPDLSFASLRSVSPIHIQYLKNMEVGASMSVSIIQKNRLWGLIACHHPVARHISYPYRQLCELLARAFAMVLGEKEEALQWQYSQQVQEVKKALFQNISKAENFTDGLHNGTPTVMDLIRCGGCVVSFGEGYTSLGITPPKEEVLALIDWLQKNIQEEVFSSRELPDLYPEGEKFSDTGSGILAIAISQVQKEYIIWFRPEVVHTVTWAGRQEKNIVEAGDEQLSPRNSFEAWAELVRNKSEKWLAVELEAAKDLRGLIVDIVLRMSGQLKLRADILSRLNEEMNSSKSEMDSFAYIASHDLKEPVRGIQTYASFVLEDYGAVLDEEGKAKLKTLIRLSSRTQQLVDSLLQFSRMGRMELNPSDTDLNALLPDVVDIFRPRFTTERISLEIQNGVWPTVSCDELRISEVFMNLISNAIKYNSKEEKRITIGFRRAGEDEKSPSGYVFFVQDNGIGINPKFHKEIFTIFRRLNARDAYGGGTGAGLTITKKIIERHGGRIWLNSELDRGSCFYFTF